MQEKKREREREKVSCDNIRINFLFLKLYDAINRVRYHYSHRLLFIHI